jgi:hypothetical protein
MKLLVASAPPPKWSVESWATHLTAVGALVGTVLGSASLPEVPRQIDKNSLVALSLLFGALVVVAPFVFQAVQSPRVSANAPEEEGGNGYTWVLLVSCWLTLGAVFGQLATLGLATWEIAGGSGGGVAIEIALGALRDPRRILPPGHPPRRPPRPTGSNRVKGDAQAAVTGVQELVERRLQHGHPRGRRRAPTWWWSHRPPCRNPHGHFHRPRCVLGHGGVGLADSDPPGGGSKSGTGPPRAPVP